jgi:hypothetical protein
MNEEQIADIWTLFKEYCDKKQIDIIAEKYVDLLADYGISDETFKEVLGHDVDLDHAVGYYLEIDADIYTEDEEDWDE